eukprot:452677_1
MATQLTCFVYPLTENDNKYGGNIQYTLYNNSINNNPIASITLNNIGLIMDTNKPSETIYATFTDNIASIDYPTIPIAQISAYISNIQCIEIISFQPTDNIKSHSFSINGQMWKTTDIALTPINTQTFTTPQSNINASINNYIYFNTMYCMQQFQDIYIESNEILAFLFTITDYSDNNKQYKPIDNGYTHDLLITEPLLLTDIEYYNINISISNAIGYLHIALWQSCNITHGLEDNNLLTTMRDINSNISFLTTVFLIVICALGLLTIFAVAYLSRKRYSRSDPVNYFAVIWMVLELWDFFSDLAYVIYLYYFTVYYRRLEFWIMFVIGVFFLVVPYTLNLCYYSFLNHLWSQENAPAVSRKWLKRYSWIFLLICLITGGVHPALEFTNSLLFPRILFSMHLPYSEIIRVRSERFVTNVLFENFPFLILQITFYFVVQGIEKDLNGGINIVFWGTVVSSILSVLFSGTYYFSYKYQLQSQIAIYSFSFGFRSDEFEHYWVHSHWRLQTAISKALQIGTPSLIVIDKVVDAYKKNRKKFIEEKDNVSLYVEGRIIHDPGSVKSKLKLMEHDLKQNEQREAMTEIGTTLLYLLRNEFNLHRTTDTVRVINLSVRNINKGNGENIFRLEYEDTLKNVCCWRCVSKQIEGINKNNIEHNLGVEMSDFGVIKSGDSGLYVVDNNREEKVDIIETNNKPTYLKKTTLPMVSISAADGEDGNNNGTKNNVIKQKRVVKHKPQFSTLSTVIRDDPYAIDELRQAYHD